MIKFFIGVVMGIFLMAAVLRLPSQPMLGATASRDLIGIYNATTTDLVLRDGYGSALAVDQYARLITTSP